MKIVRFKAAGKTRYGVLEGSQVVEYGGTPFGAFTRGRRKFPLKQVVLLPPVVPGKIVAIGLNYRDHAEEVAMAIPEEPYIFFKPPSALIGPEDPIVLPEISERVDYEGELAIVMKKRCRSVPAARARDYVLGYTCLNDVTARDIQRRDGGPCRAKAFDTFAPMGPCIATDIEPNAVDIETYLNGERRQASNTKMLIFPIEDVIARISQVMTLLPGDAITTGTPAGIGPMHAGDRVEIRIEGIGTLKNSVVKIP
jgi:2-keto-4-pentenoate hydratase/2-oxohepta-3-ene-1,7-dioic acid hydratase in catechol pathway